MSDVKRFWADLCVQHVEAVLYSDYAALEAELAKLRAGQEPVAVVDKHVPSAEIQWTDHGEELCLPHGTKLYTAPQPSAVPDGFVLAEVKS